MAAGRSSTLVRPLAYELVHKLRIERFANLLKTYPTYCDIRGAEFGHALDPDCRFFVNIYPNGSRLFFQGFVSVFVHLKRRRRRAERCGSSGEKKAEEEEEEEQGGDERPAADDDRPAANLRYCSMRFSVIDCGGIEVLSRSASHALAAEGSSETAGGDWKTNWGFRRFCSATALSEQLGADGVLTLQCTLAVSCPPQHRRFFRSVLIDRQLDRQRWIDAVDGFLSRDDECRVCVRTAGGEMFRVHRWLLAAHSAVFEARYALRNSTGDGDKLAPLDLSDVDADTFRAFLKFLYGQEEEEEGANASSVGDLVSLLLFADKYMVESLLGQCQRQLCDRLNASNAAEALQRLPTHCLSKELLNSALETITTNLTDFLTSAGWSCLVHSDSRRAVSLLETLLRHCFCNDDEHERRTMFDSPGDHL